MQMGALVAALLLSTMALAQSPALAASDPAAGSLSAGLVVWRVVSASSLRPITPASLSPQVSSQTAGSFGQPASTIGNTAGATGQTSGSFGQTSSSVGQTAGSFGQTAGSFGETSTSLPSAAARSNGTVPSRRSDPEWDRFIGSARDKLSILNVVYKDIGIDELEARLQDVAGSSDAPDVLVGTPFPPAWSRQDSGLVRRFGLVTLGDIAIIPQEETPEPRSQKFRPQASVLRSAPNPMAARAFVDWLYGGSAYANGGRAANEAQAPVEAAKSALLAVLSGHGLGSNIDPQAAPFNAELARMIALNVEVPDLLTNLGVRIDAVAAEANTRFATVGLRATLESKSAFGVIHAVVVLRADEAGRWRVLQITPNLQAEQQVFSWGILHPYGSRVAPESVATVLGVSQAAPADGDNRDRSPELWWDNHGGATLEIVEWQRKAGDSWNNSNLFFVPDDNGHLRTRVTARFADSAGPYRWRIWSVGRGGVVVIGSWRSLNILAH